MQRKRKEKETKMKLGEVVRIIENEPAESPLQIPSIPVEPSPQRETVPA